MTAPSWRPLASLGVLLAVWELAVRTLPLPPLILPAPSEVAVALWNGLASGVYERAFLFTAGEAVSGFLLAAVSGIAFGTLVTKSRVMEAYVYPYLVALQSMPKIALAPLIVVWFGYGTSSKVVTAALAAFFPVLVNVIVGLRGVPRGHLDLLRGLTASRWQMFRYVEFPNALPVLFAGLNVAAVFAVLGAVIGEFVGSREGLGNLLTQLNFNLDIAGVFSVLILLGLLGSTLHWALGRLRRRAIYWTRTDELLAL